jgi:divinyl chlorophyllide a 8-vinyl-reductase
VSRILLLGATGTIGRATARELVGRGHDVVAFVRPDGGAERLERLPTAVECRAVDALAAASVSAEGFRGEPFDAVVSCMASRTGLPRDAWAVDHRAHLNVLDAAQKAGVHRFVLLSAICLQRPRLEFQRAKLAFEEALRTRGIDWSIVRATAFFKSLSGQVERVRRGKPYLIFGDGRLNACKPIGDEDLATFLADCITDPARRNRVLPIGGPGPALTPRDQGELLFSIAGRTPRFRSMPLGLMTGIVRGLDVLGRILPPLADKAELARIGHYYATESMLVWDPVARRFDADATPEFGRQTLGDYFAGMLRGEIQDDRGDHAVL